MRKNRFPVVMKTTALLTGVGTCVLGSLYCAGMGDWLFSAAITCGTTFYHFGMRLLVGAFVPLLTRNANPEHPWFRQRSWEPGLYRRLKVKNWKKDLPTYDPGQFDLKKNSLHQVVRNMCNAELVHEVIVVFSFIPLLFAISFGALSAFLITSVVAALYDSIFIVAQRYNRPKLVRILRKKEARP